MMRGAIDHTTTDRIGGWIYSLEYEFRGKAVLAFLDHICVGAGSIDGYRKDLAEAGFGDGVLGFNFKIAPTADNDLGRLVVKIEGSDFALLQSGSRVEGAASAAQACAADRSLASIEWMRTAGWLDQPEYDFLKFIRQIGIYDRSLHRSRTASATPGVDEPAVAAGTFFSLLCQKPVVPIEQTFSDAEDFAARRANLLADMAEPIAAVWSANAGEMLVVEGSHTDAANQGSGSAAYVAYSFGPDRLLFVDLRCEFALSGEQSDELRVLILPRE